MDGLKRMSLDQPLHLQIQGEGKPNLKGPDERYFAKTTLPWMSIGYETQLPPLNILTFYNAIANDGVMVRPKFVKALLLVGGFFGQYVGMRRTDKLIHDEIEGLSISGLETFRQRLPEKNPSPVVVYARRLLDAGADRPLKDKLLSEFEIHADKDMAWSRYLAKLGPMLGLMGTLIPMGPALVGLSTGDIGSMAYNMQVAFATTVVGMVSAAIGYFTEQVKQRWYLKDLTALQYLSDVLDGGAASGRAQAEGGEAR